MTDLTSTSSTRNWLPITTPQVLKLLATGVALWLLAAVLLRLLGPLGIYEGSARLWTYVLIIPGTVPFIYLVRWIARLGPEHTVLGVAIVTAMAIVCDGIALAWAPEIYGEGLATAAGAGATILWGAGVGIFLACLLNRQPVG
ncbi:hypothetical protein [Roseobacter sinensis]|uniref:Uncharacterized protein n=1 Tax=Roseobacter sinensis TaxID=2931391 RepID=A0ABT3BF98_9RHOB|nr:hypothetical protein [Roseobacter sp. WL0113]MCV3272253.1 hypothetical protein [Roseobacter sp. WL0113]